MWYGIIPHCTVMYIAMAGPYYFIPIWNKFRRGNEYNRDRGTLFENQYYWMRDENLGNPYKPHSLDALSDEPVA